MSEDSVLVSGDLGRETMLMYKSPAEDRCGVNLGDNYSRRVLRYSRLSSIGGFRELTVKDTGLVELYVETPYAEILDGELEGEKTSHVRDLDSIEENFDIGALEEDYDALDRAVRELEQDIIDFC